MIKTDNKGVIGKENKVVSCTGKQSSETGASKPTSTKQAPNASVKDVFKVPQPVSQKPHTSKDDVIS